MSQLKHKLLHIGIIVALAFVASMLFVLGLDAESGSRSKRGTRSLETSNAIHTAFEDNDYDAYVAAVTAKHRQSILTKEEFDSHVQKIAEKQKIQDAFADADYQTYLELTDGSIYQLSEAAFTKKSKMFALKEEIQTALTDRDYDSFTKKRQELKDLLGDEYVSHGHYDGSDEITEDQFNVFADKHETYGTDGLGWKKQRGYHGNKCGHSSRYSW